VLTRIYASCSTTRCTMTLPAERAETVEIAIYADSLWRSRGTRADRFTYKS
jgi:hypothetical protein